MGQTIIQYNINYCFINPKNSIVSTVDEYYAIVGTIKYIIPEVYSTIPSKFEYLTNYILLFTEILFIRNKYFFVVD